MKDSHTRCDPPPETGSPLRTRWKLCVHGWFYSSRFCLSAVAIDSRLTGSLPPGTTGKDGIVLAAKSKDRPGRFAIKVLRWPEEKRVYERLGDAAVATILGFNGPQCIGCDDDLCVLELTIVERPFVLDFAGAHLDARPEFPVDVWADWEADKREQFEERWPAVQQVLAAFEELGIYLLDVSPSNIGFVD